MSLTRPRGEQLRFNSATTGNHVLDTYLEAAERGGRPLSDLLADLFTSGGIVRQDIFEFRFNPATYAIQARSGDYVDPEANWTTITTIFRARGVFANATAYAQFDIFTYLNSTYIVTVAHTSSGSVPDPTKTAIIISGADLNTAVASADASADAAAASATTAATQATTATTQAGIATTQAGAAATSASTATTQAGIATTQAGIAATEAATATTQAGIATTGANTATTQAGIATAGANTATTQAGIATTQAGIATTQAGNAATSAATAAATALATFNANIVLTGIGTLVDVDTGPTPPAVGSGLVWDGTNYIPGPAGGGMFKGDNGTVGSRSGDIFRISEQQLDADVTIAATENAYAPGPLAVATGFTLTVSSGGNLVIL